MQQSQARQLHKELQDTMVQLEAIRHEIRSISILNPGPLTWRLVDNVDNRSVSNDSSISENQDVESTLKASISKPSSEHIITENIPASTIFKASDSCSMHSQSAAYARLAKASAQNPSLLDSGADTEKLIYDAGIPNVLPVSAESAGMLPKRADDVKGSDIVLEAILEADVAKNAKDFCAQPQNQIKYE